MSSLNDFALIRPIAPTDAMVVSSIPEPVLAGAADPDPAAWAAATTYATGAQVYRATTHKIYQRINQAVAAADATLPETDAALATPTKWVEVGSVNRRRMFDAANESQSSANEQIVVQLTLGQMCDSLAVLNVEGTTARLQELTTGYDKTVQLTTRAVASWSEYFTEPFNARQDVVFSGIPLRLSNVMVLTVTNPGGVAKVGNLVPGRARRLGGTKFGASAGIIDYTQKSTNAFGLTTVVKRPYSKRMNVELIVTAEKVDEVQRLLALNRATPLVFAAAGNLYGALIAYGFIRSFEIVIAYPRYSIVSLEIEGLT